MLIARPLLLALLILLTASCSTMESSPRTLVGNVNAPPPALAGDDSLLTYTMWVWQDTQLANGTRVVPDTIGSYTLEFQPNGVVNVRADCNRGKGTYTQTGAQLTIGSIALTRMQCSAGSRDNEFLKALASVSEQALRGNDLVLILRANGGTMRFGTPRS